LRRLRHDFEGKTKSNSPNYYDLFDDWELIEASFAQQYHIRLRDEDKMSWDEFTTLLAGLGPETPLGSVVHIRAEKDSKKIKHFTPEQRRIRSEWFNRHKVEGGSEEYMQQMKMLSEAFKSLAKKPK